MVLPSSQCHYAADQYVAVRCGSCMMRLLVVQVWVHGLMATLHAYLPEMNEHTALYDVRMQVPL